MIYDQEHKGVFFDLAKTNLQVFSNIYFIVMLCHNACVWESYLGGYLKTLILELIGQRSKVNKNIVLKTKFSNTWETIWSFFICSENDSPYQISDVMKSENGVM